MQNKQSKALLVENSLQDLFWWNLALASLLQCTLVRGVFHGLAVEFWVKSNFEYHQPWKYVSIFSKEYHKSFAHCIFVVDLSQYHPVLVRAVQDFSTSFNLLNLNQSLQHQKEIKVSLHLASESPKEYLQLEFLGR